mmetsp:Transcript_23515/g.46328  ORF Transcript_23515/g.46328 Transcript_23515/m.46328 type:complete len:390 (+) Transcript_23515:25-1194(+)
MTEYWKSIPKHWCKVCKLFITGTKRSIKTHEDGLKHKDLVQKQLREMSKAKIKEDREQSVLMSEIEKIEKAALAACQADMEAGQKGYSSASLAKPQSAQSHAHKSWNALAEEKSIASDPASWDYIKYYNSQYGHTASGAPDPSAASEPAPLQVSMPQKPATPYPGYYFDHNAGAWLPDPSFVAAGNQVPQMPSAQPKPPPPPGIAPPPGIKRPAPAAPAADQEDSRKKRKQELEAEILADIAVAEEEDHNNEAATEVAEPEEVEEVKEPEIDEATGLGMWQTVDKPLYSAEETAVKPVKKKKKRKKKKKKGASSDENISDLDDETGATAAAGADDKKAFLAEYGFSNLVSTKQVVEESDSDDSDNPKPVVTFKKKGKRERNIRKRPRGI